MHSSQIVIIVILVIYVGLSCLLCYSVIDELCTNLHKLLSVIATMLTGIAMLVFRLLRGSRTRVVKYIHTIIHSLAIVLYVIGFIPSTAQKYYIEVHPIPGFVIMGCWGLQYTVALIVFTCCISNPRWRLYFAPFHDIFGIWLFICMVGCCMGANVDARLAGYPAYNLIFIITAFVCFILVVAVVLSPFFEWELVGLL